MFTAKWLIHNQKSSNTFDFSCNGYSLSDVTTSDLKDVIIIIKNHIGIPIKGLDECGKEREGYRITNAQKLATSILHNKNDRRWTEAIETFEELIRKSGESDCDLKSKIASLKCEREGFVKRIAQLEKELENSQMIPIKSTRPRPAKKPVTKVVKAKR